MEFAAGVAEVVDGELGERRKVVSFDEGVDPVLHFETGGSRGGEWRLWKLSWWLRKHEVGGVDGSGG